MAVQSKKSLAIQEVAIAQVPVIADLAAYLLHPHQVVHLVVAGAQAEAQVVVVEALAVLAVADNHSNHV